MKYFLHELSDVMSKSIGENTKIWQFVVVLEKAVLGNNCNINANVLIENDVVIGDNVTVKSGVQIWDGVTIEDNVFIGPNVTFTNDITPRSKIYPENFSKTIIRKRATIGANATIIAGIVIEEGAMIGAGSVVTKSIGKNELWFGNPAKHQGYITNNGDILDLCYVSKKTGKQYNIDEDGLLEND